MPALPDANKVLKIVLEHTLGDANVVNVFHWLYQGGAASSTDLNTIASDVGTAWHGNVMNLLSNQLELTSVEVTDLTSHTAPVGEALTALNGSGTGVVLAASSAVVLSHKIARRYRGGHPRSYLGGIVQADLNSPQILHDANVAAFTSGFAAFRAAVAAISLTTTTPLVFGSLSYFSGGVLRTTPVFDPALGTSCQARICSQRRRSGRLIVE